MSQGLCLSAFQASLVFPVHEATRARQDDKHLSVSNMLVTEAGNGLRHGIQ